MGWSIPWVSSGSSDFDRDCRAWTEEDRANGTGYNFGTPKNAGVDTANDMELMALSVFVLEDGVVYHTYACFDRGTDGLNVVWQAAGPHAEGAPGRLHRRLAEPPRRVRPEHARRGLIEARRTGTPVAWAASTMLMPSARRRTS